MDEKIKNGDPSPATEKSKEESASPAIRKEEITVREPKKAKELPKVSIVRNWKEYLGESLLIVFSVALALALTEIITNINNERRTKEVLHQLREELISNKQAEEEQYVYHLQTLKKIDSALENPSIAEKFIAEGKVNLDVITPPPHGLLLHDLNSVAWEIAKRTNIFSKIDLKTYSLLTDIYNNQDHITKSEDEIAKILLSWESRKPGNVKTTLILIHNNYVGWATGRAPRLLKLYQQAIDKLSKF